MQRREREEGRVLGPETEVGLAVAEEVDLPGVLRARPGEGDGSGREVGRVVFCGEVEDPGEAG